MSSRELDTVNGGLLGGLKGSLSVVQNFYIEFFGTLIPGIVAVVCVLVLGLGICYVASVDVGTIKECIRIVFSTFGGVAAFLVISYVMGAIVYRRSPKTPDTIASYSQWRLTRSGSASDEIGRMSVTFDASNAIPSGILERVMFWLNREHWILRKAGSSIDFPYPLMRKYLCCRGLNHLADYVPWCAGSGGSAFKENFKKGVCSKVYVNIIKQRLRNSGHENLIMDMVRNECHIRMLCSLWYIFTFVFRVLLISFVCVFCWKSPMLFAPSPDSTVKLEPCDSVLVKTNAVDTQVVTSMMQTSSDRSFVLGYESETVKKQVSSKISKADIMTFHVVLLAGIVLVFYCRGNIERGLHYVRTREVAMILESAWIMDNIDFKGRLCVKREDGKPLFQDIKDIATGFKESHCAICKYYRLCYSAEFKV